MLTRKIQLLTRLAAGLLLGGPLTAGATEPLGQVEVLVGPYPCLQAECYDLEVTCPQVIEPAAATLMVNEADPGAPPRGTILFATGSGGGRLWQTFGAAAMSTIRRLNQEGFLTVQLSWTDGWLNAAPDAEEGQVRLACRPATVARWIYDNLHQATPTTAFCATGNSGGASQLAYMLTHYGLADLLEVVVFSGGPVMSRIDEGCLGGPPVDGFPVTYGAGEANLIDLGFGFLEGGGPCNARDPAFAPAWTRASHNTLHLPNYVFPDTLVWFVFGALDVGSARGQGLLFRARLLEAGTPFTGMSIALNTGHDTPSTRQGAGKIRVVLEAGCVP